MFQFVNDISPIFYILSNVKTVDMTFVGVDIIVAVVVVVVTFTLFFILCPFAKFFFFVGDATEKKEAKLRRYSAIY